MWKNYFKKGKILGIDIYDKSNLEEKRITIFQGDQKDKSFLEYVIKKVGIPDIIIDDGSHINKDIITSFKYLFPFLKSGGCYVIEDTQTSYINGYGGNNRDLNAANTTMNFFKNLVDNVNENQLNNDMKRHIDFSIKIKEIHFYNKIIFIIKS